MSLLLRLRTHGFFTTGTIIPGLVLHGKPAPYPVVNDRAVRAGAGIMLALAVYAFSQAWFLSDFLPLQIVVVIFFVEFSMKAVVGTRFAPIGRLAAFLVRRQAPEYVGAIQKQFAWSLGLSLATIMILLLFVFDVRGPINLAICSLCMTFMYLETSFGVCVGCKIYNGLLAVGILRAPTYKPVCPGNVCAIE
jgi:hypothetical protein